MLNTQLKSEKRAKKNYILPIKCTPKNLLRFSFILVNIDRLSVILFFYRSQLIKKICYNRSLPGIDRVIEVDISVYIVEDTAN